MNNKNNLIAYDELEKALNEYFPKCPIPYEKWGRGRPSKAKLARRKEYNNWWHQYYKDHPREQDPLLSQLRAFVSDRTKLKTTVIKKRQVMVQYNQPIQINND